MTHKEALALREAIRGGRHLLSDHGIDIGRIVMMKKDALELLDAFIDLDEIHRLADRHVGDEYREKGR